MVLVHALTYNMALYDDYGPQASAAKQITRSLAKVAAPTESVTPVDPPKPKVQGLKGTLKWRAKHKDQYNEYQSRIMRRRRAKA